MFKDRTAAAVTDEALANRFTRIHERAATVAARPRVETTPPVQEPVRQLTHWSKVPMVVTPTDKPVSDVVRSAKEKVQKPFMDSIDFSVISQYSGDKLVQALTGILDDILADHKILINAAEKSELIEIFIDDMFGLGPLQPLLDDDTISDVMVNGPDEVYVERRGMLEKTSVRFENHDHIANIAARIANRVGRRVDESSPMVDARLLDGSRVNIILPPLAFKSPTISIRKFASKVISLEQMVQNDNVGPDMAMFLKLATRARLNILVSGGTGSGKTTLLNALSEHIDPRERIVTIEDAAELRLEQPHLVTLETRPANLEGNGKVTIRDLLINSLRMRPDRIIVGEVRSDEAIDMLQAMNTGHDGSLGTIHANTPRDALSRLENLYAMSGVILPTAAVRAQIASALDLVVQTERLSDGTRRITSIVEIAGMEGDVITSQEVYNYKYTRQLHSDKIDGEFVFNGMGARSEEKITRAGLGEQVRKLKKQ